MARQLIDSIRGHLSEARLLIDAWFMRKSLILPMLEQGVRIIGQVRRDTVLCLPPEPEPKRRGRKRKYGRRIDAVLRDALPAQELELWVVWQGATRPDALGDCGSPGSARRSGTGGVVRDASGRRCMVAPTFDSCDRNKSDGARCGGDLCHALGYRAFVPQSEAVVGCDESVAAVEGGAGTVDADSLHCVCIDANACLEAVDFLSVDGDCPLAQGGNDHRGALRSMAAYSIYRTSRARCLSPEVGEFRHAFPGAGPAFAVLRCTAWERSASIHQVLAFVMARYRRTYGRREAACV